MEWLRRLRAVGRLLVDWDVFKHALDAAVQDELLRRRVEIVLASEPMLAAEYASLRALWSMVERDMKELR